MSNVAERARPSVRGWVGVAAIVLGVAATWLPTVGLPLGDSHEGRILGRFALQVRNFQQLGAWGSGLASDWSPYASSHYAHHPPLANALHVLVASLFGLGEAQLRSVGYAAGLLSIVGLAGLLRVLGLRWGSVLVTLCLTVATGYFWAFGRLGLGFVFIVWLAAAVVVISAREHPGGLLVAGTALLATATVMSSWQGMVVSALFGLWLWRRRGADGVTVTVGVSMVLGVVLTALWISYASGFGSLGVQLEERTTSLDFTAVEFVIRQAGFFFRALPVWYLALALPALWAGIADRRTRPLVLITLGVAVTFAVGLPENAYIHEFWNYGVLLPFGLGMAVLFERMAGAIRRPVLRAGVGLALVLSVGWIGWLTFDGAEQRFFRSPAVAGQMVKDHAAPAGQERAWVIGVAAPRWISFYWDLPVGVVNEADLGSVPDTDLVLLKLSNTPDWVPSDARTSAVLRRGNYALVRAGDLR